jgi:predicted GIY-YIG superfamily endonuclease
MQVRGAAVCMLRCADGSYYVGSTKGDNMASRPAQHEAGDWERIRPLARKRHHGT